MPIVDITTTSDADFSRAFVWHESGGGAIDLTSSSLLMQIRKAASDPGLLFEASTVNGKIVITNAAAGAFTLKLPWSFLKNLPAGIYAHSLVRKAPSGARDEVWRGTINHLRTSTQDNATT